MAAGSFYEVEVRPEASGWSARLTAQLEPQMRALADNIRRRLGDAVRDGLSGSGFNPGVRGTDTGRQYADAFSRTLKAKLEAAFRNLPDIKLNANSTAVDRELAEIRAKMRRLLTDDTYRLELGIDDKQVLVHVEEMRARLARLARESPDIRVRVNTGSALAELEALKRGLDGFDGRGSRVRRLFSGDLFGDVFRSLGSSLRSSNGLLDSTIGKLGSFTDKIKGLSDEATQGAKSNPIVGLVTTNLAVTGIVVALTTVGPLIAAASGAALGLAGAAGAALLAFRGIQNQMTLNVGYGRALQREFSGVVAIVDRLGSVVADAIGPGLIGALSSVRAALPSFGGLFKSIGSQLGDVAGSLTTALLDVFRNAGPVILQVVGYIKQGAARLSEWTGSEGFKQFLAYAARELPVVGNAVGSIGKLLVSAFVAFAPVGEIVLRILTGIANIASGVFDVVGKVIGFFSGDGSPTANGPASQIGALAAQLSTLGQVSVVTDAASSGLARTLGTTNAAYKTAQDAVAANAEQLAATTLQMQLQSDAAGLLKQQLDRLSGKNLGVEQTLSSFQQGLLGIDDTFTKARFSATDFTDAAVAQRAELQQLVAAAQAHAEAVGTQTGSTKAATDALAADYAQILQNTHATGDNAAGIAAYIQQIGAIPPVAMTKVEADTAAASALVARFSDTVTHLPPGTVVVNVNTETAAASINRFISTPRTAYVQVQTVGPTGGSGGRALLPNSAYGNIFSSVGQYAYGGVLDGMTAKLQASAKRFARGSEAHIPQIAMPNGGVRIWAEPETQGEAYIPFALDRRQRAEGILSDVAKRFGGAYLPQAPAAPVASGNSGGSGLVGMTVTIDAGSVGTLTGYVTDVADGRITASDRAKTAAARGGPSRPY